MWIKEIQKDCDHQSRPAPQNAAKSHGIGSVWKCDQCDKPFELRMRIDRNMDVWFWKDYVTADQ